MLTIILVLGILGQPSRGSAAAQSAAHRVADQTAGPQQGPPIDATTLAQATTDVHFTVRWVTYNGEYQLQIQSLTTLGTVTQLNWAPPPSLNIDQITSTSGGKCEIAASGEISCSTKLSPPSCKDGTCYPNETTITIDFKASLTGNPPGSSFTDLFWESHLQVTHLVPALPAFSDLPLCTKGQHTSTAHPCAPK